MRVEGRVNLGNVSKHGFLNVLCGTENRADEAAINDTGRLLKYLLCVYDLYASDTIDKAYLSTKLQDGLNDCTHTKSGSVSFLTKK